MRVYLRKTASEVSVVGIEREREAEQQHGITSRIVLGAMSEGKDSGKR